MKALQIEQIKTDAIERTINYHTAAIESGLGVSGTLPRFPERNLIHTESITLNNLSVENSNIGVLNTGYLNIIDSAITTIRDSGNELVAKSLSSFSSAVANDSCISPDTKNEIIELLQTLSAEAAAPKDSQKKSVVKRMLTGIKESVQASALLCKIWDTVGPIIENYFEN
ncbi:MAG: hypothetical protein AAFY98_09950 [Verrucomicrobiota bacterium]